MTPSWAVHTGYTMRLVGHLSVHTAAGPSSGLKTFREFFKGGAGE